jgi:hypothetical protein
MGRGSDVGDLQLPVDMVVCSDCIYMATLITPLVQTMVLLSNAHTKIWVCSLGGHKVKWFTQVTNGQDGATRLDISTTAPKWKDCFRRRPWPWV